MHEKPWINTKRQLKLWRQQIHKREKNSNNIQIPFSIACFLCCVFFPFSNTLPCYANPLLLFHQDKLSFEILQKIIVHFVHTLLTHSPTASVSKEKECFSTERQPMRLLVLNFTCTRVRASQSEYGRKMSVYSRVEGNVSERDSVTAVVMETHTALYPARTY